MSTPQVSADDFAARSFDYLIVGGGTAGLVIAARLSENPDISVGVLEAGSAVFDGPAISVPGRYGESLGTEHDWQYETIAQPGLNGRSLPWPRGKVLGGTSALNFMTWNRPCKEDLDAWAELGNTGWGWNDVLPFYKKSENFTEPSDAHVEQHRLFYDREALGSGGPLQVSYQKEYSASHDLWHDTLQTLGVETNKSHFTGSNVGAWTNIVAVEPKTATRAFSAVGYYLPVAHRKNFTVLTGAAVQSIDLEPEGSGFKATGVLFEHAEKTYTAKASTEIIIAAGSVASPQLLELSGVGNPVVLEAAGIQVKVANRNVGENLQDHIMTVTIFEIDSSVDTPDDLRTDSKLAKLADDEYAASRTGRRTMLPVAVAYTPFSTFASHEELTAFAQRISTASPQDRVKRRRLEEAQRLGQIEYIFDVGNWSTFYTSEPGKKYGTMLQMVQYPFSRGSIHISKDAPRGKPVIDPQYYGGETGALDLEFQQLSARFGEKISQTEPLKTFIKRRVFPPENIGDAELRDWIVNTTVTDWHPVGTCSMGGHEGIQGGVVDDRLRVYGVKGLRVADASIMPLQISAHLQATVYAIAEKASQMILEDRK